MSGDAGASAHAARRSAARGASSVALSRLGNVIEVVSQPAYTWMFGLPAYGLYQVLWSLVNIAENIFDLGVTSGLQRILPRAADAAEKAQAVRAALLLGLLPNCAVAVLACLAAPLIAGRLNVAAQDLPRLVTAIRLFAWALPLWAVIEVSTSAVRACHAFGPEVRLRLMWEQMARLGAAVALWAAGMHMLGLLIAHLISLSITAAAALRLLDRYVPLRDILGVRAGRAMTGDMLWSGLSVLPANILGRVFSDMATVAANLLAPGAAGASAAGVYAIARKVASIPQIVRQTFGYVLGPIAAAQVRGDRATIQALYDFAVRLSLLLALPTCAALIAAGPALLGLFARGAEAGLPILAILTAARGVEAVIGPASAIQQVIGRRSLPLLNSALSVAARSE
uniref:lipopolysaccharide biosynthesis protein n=1 Tax=Sphingomonas bacterium TaxID=1895847 RepID=UPI00266F424C